MARGSAAIDVVDFSSHVGGVLKIVDCPHDIIDLAITIERRERAQRFEIGAVVQRRHHDAERDRVDANVARGEFQGEAARGCHAGPLGEGGENRRNCFAVRVPRGLWRSGRCVRLPGASSRGTAACVAKNTLSRFVRITSRYSDCGMSSIRPGAPNPGVVDQRVDAAETLNGGLDHFACNSRITDVTGDCHIVRVMGVRDRARVANRAPTALAERPHERLAQAAGGSGGRRRLYGRNSWRHPCFSGSQRRPARHPSSTSSSG